MDSRKFKKGDKVILIDEKDLHMSSIQLKGLQLCKTYIVSRNILSPESLIYMKDSDNNEYAVYAYRLKLLSDFRKEKINEIFEYEI